MNTIIIRAKQQKKSIPLLKDLPEVLVRNRKYMLKLKLAYLRLRKKFKRPANCYRQRTACTSTASVVKFYAVLRKLLAYRKVTHLNWCREVKNNLRRHRIKLYSRRWKLLIHKKLPQNIPARQRNKKCKSKVISRGSRKIRRELQLRPSIVLKRARYANRCARIFKKVRLSLLISSRQQLSSIAVDTLSGILAWVVPSHTTLQSSDRKRKSWRVCSKTPYQNATRQIIDNNLLSHCNRPTMRRQYTHNLLQAREDLRLLRKYIVICTEQNTMQDVFQVELQIQVLRRRMRQYKYFAVTVKLSKAALLREQLNSTLRRKRISVANQSPSKQYTRRRLGSKTKRQRVKGPLETLFEPIAPETNVPLQWRQLREFNSKLQKFSQNKSFHPGKLRTLSRVNKDTFKFSQKMKNLIKTYLAIRRWNRHGSSVKPLPPVPWHIKKRREKMQLARANFLRRRRRGSPYHPHNWRKRNHRYGLIRAASRRAYRGAWKQPHRRQSKRASGRILEQHCVIFKYKNFLPQKSQENPERRERPTRISYRSPESVYSPKITGRLCAMHLRRKYTRKSRFILHRKLLLNKRGWCASLSLARLNLKEREARILRYLARVQERLYANHNIYAYKIERISKKWRTVFDHEIYYKHIVPIRRVKLKAWKKRRRKARRTRRRFYTRTGKTRRKTWWLVRRHKRRFKVKGRQPKRYAPKSRMRLLIRLITAALHNKKRIGSKRTRCTKRCLRVRTNSRLPVLFRVRLKTFTYRLKHVN